ncbi:AraC family transcriptional regulator [Chitinophagaceae bacterium MMS25-I14]
MKHLVHPVSLSPLSNLQTLVENRRVYNMEQCELNIFETFHTATDVSLRFSDFVFTSMLRGKKLMQLAEGRKFDYLPGESVIVSPDETMRIDFPEAEEGNPTQCIALCISRDLINHTLSFLNDAYPKAEAGAEWYISNEHFFLLNNRELTKSIDQVVYMTTATNRLKDATANTAIQKLLIRLMQTQARQLFEQNYKLWQSQHRLAHIIDYIKSNLHERITIDTLSKKACMSKPHFFRCFRQEFGLSPVEYILKERIELAKQHLSDGLTPVTDAAYRAGFSSVNYFIRVFKALEGITPKLFQQQLFTPVLLPAGRS